MSTATRSRTPRVPSHEAVPSPRRAAVTHSPGTTLAPPRPRPVWPADDVSDAGMDSFPASDPPSWGPLRVGAPAARDPAAPLRA